jgi:hypothetical protein
VYNGLRTKATEFSFFFVLEKTWKGHFLMVTEGHHYSEQLVSGLGSSEI